MLLTHSSSSNARTKFLITVAAITSAVFLLVNLSADIQPSVRSSHTHYSWTKPTHQVFEEAQATFTSEPYFEDAFATDQAPLPTSTLYTVTRTQTVTTTPTSAIARYPHDYISSAPELEWCRERYSTDFLDKFANNHTTFCSGGASTLRCFSSQRGRRPSDYFCVADGVAVSDKKFHLSCDMPEEKQEELQQFPEYMWWTGVRKILKRDFTISGDDDIKTRVESLQCGASDKRRSERSTAVLFMRDGGSNNWHSLMEVMMYYASMDILSLARDSAGQPFFDADLDTANLQVLWADAKGPGPYADLWSLFSSKPTMHVGDLDPSTTCFDRVIIPLPGGMNPLWDGDWEPRPCTSNAILDAFVARVLRHMKVANDPPLSLAAAAGFNSTGSVDPDTETPLTVTIIDRRQTRSIAGLQTKLELLRTLYPSITFRTVDLRNTTFQAQLRLMRDTDVLVGSHGAGLTGQMFMRPERRGAVVELLPEGLMHKGFRNLAQMRGLGYYSTHGVKVEGDHLDRWDLDPVRVEDGEFVRLVEMAIAGVRNKGRWNVDAV